VNLSCKSVSHKHFWVDGFALGYEVFQLGRYVVSYSGIDFTPVYEIALIICTYERDMPCHTCEETRT
jgi:hypothetical protein